jgi:hypothetical protein
MTTLAQVYRRAAEVIDERGWFQGWYADPDGRRVCMLGACAVALGAEFETEGRSNGEPRVVFARDADNTMWHKAWDGLHTKVHKTTKWNDESGRTAEQVKAALLEAAELHEAADRG